MSRDVFNRNNKIDARVAVAAEERDAAARALEEGQAESAARLPEAAEGTELDVRDTEERRDEERDEGARRLAERQAEAARAWEEEIGANFAALADEPCMIVS